MDRMIGNYSVKYKPRRCHVVVFGDALNIACYNSFVLFSEVFPESENDNCHKRRLFLIDSETKLSASYRGARQRLLSGLSCKKEEKIQNLFRKWSEQKNCLLLQELQDSVMPETLPVYL